MKLEADRTAVIALHWQVNVIKPEGFFGGMLAEPVARSGVLERAVRFHQTAGLPIFYTRFTVPEDEGGLVRNTPFMQAVGENQAAFRPDSAGTQLIPEMAAVVSSAPEQSHIVDNQKLSG